eukprot:9040653-Pyramimonas_sp.AAC.2
MRQPNEAFSEEIGNGAPPPPGLPLPAYPAEGGEDDNRGDIFPNAEGVGAPREALERSGPAADRLPDALATSMDEAANTMNRYGPTQLNKQINMLKRLSGDRR